jgi:hypothetical protein
MTRQWSEWREHTAGEPCPIPNAKAGEYEVRTEHGVCTQSNKHAAQLRNVWQNGFITHYRVLLPEPVKDWESVARDLADASQEAKLQIEYLEHRFVITGTGRTTLVKINSALNTYEEMKK